MKISCPYCGQCYEVEDSFSGNKALCEKCGNHFIIGAPPVAEEAADEASGATPAETPDLSQFERPLGEDAKKSFPLKNLIGWLALLTIIGGFVLVMRSQSIKNEQRTLELKNEREAARRLEEEKHRQEEEQRKLARQQERERLARERIEDEKRREAERERRIAERDRLRQVEERRGKLQKRRDELNARLNQLKSAEKASGDERILSPEIREMKNELDRINRTLADPRYKCFDFCVKFRHLDFAQRARKKGSNTCEQHHVSWTPQQLREYERNYVHLPKLETRKKQLEYSLANARRGSGKKFQQEIEQVNAELKRVDSAIAALDARPENPVPAAAQSGDTAK